MSRFPRTPEVAVEVGITMLVLRDQDGRGPGGMWSVWRYDVTDPLAVTVVFPQDAASEEYQWRFARGLLVDALRGQPAGVGDVRLCPAADGASVLSLTLSSPDGAALFQVPARRLRMFLDRTLLIVRHDEEHIPEQVIDAAVAGWLGKGTPRGASFCGRSWCERCTARAGGVR